MTEHFWVKDLTRYHFCSRVSLLHWCYEREELKPQHINGNCFKGVWGEEHYHCPTSSGNACKGRQIELVQMLGKLFNI